MTTSDTLMYGYGIFLILGAIFIVGCLTFKRSVWDYPPIVSVYIAFAVFLLFYGIVFIKRIEITKLVEDLFYLALIIWFLITMQLPSVRNKKDNKIEANKGN